jgi:hypothetical protein
MNCEANASTKRDYGVGETCQCYSFPSDLVEGNNDGASKEHRVVIVGVGFAGFNAARKLSKLLGALIEIVLINSTDYFLYVPLMPQVGGGLLEPRHICVSLPRRLGNVRFVLGTVRQVDSQRKVVSWDRPAGRSGQLGYDRLILTAGSVNKLLPIPGVAEYAHGFRNIAEAIYLRDHITRQLELATDAADTPERTALCTFVVVGAGYTGTEVAAQGEVSCSPPGSPGGCPDWLDGRYGGCCSTPHRACYPNLTRAFRRPLTVSCAGAGSRYEPASRSPRQCLATSSCRPGSRCRPDPSSGASGYAPTRWWMAWTWRPAGGGLWSTSSCPCRGPRRSTPAGIAQRCPT